MIWHGYRTLYGSLIHCQSHLREVATHNHFALDRGGKVFNQTAPVIKLPECATEDDHLALLGVLNSSTACFWLKQVCQIKGGQWRSVEAFKDEAWEDFYEFTGTKLEQFPLPADPAHSSSAAS